MQRSMDGGALSPCAHISTTVSAAMAPGTSRKGVRKLCQKTRMSTVKQSLLEKAVKTETTITMEIPSLDKAVGDCWLLGEAELVTFKNKPPYWLFNVEFRVASHDTQMTQHDYVGGARAPMFACACICDKYNQRNRGQQHESWEHEWAQGR